MKPRVVCVGGGHGLAATLRAATTYAAELTGIVSVADDGGSSGRIRQATGLPAMGDIRRCLSALADPSVPLSTVFEYRFEGDPEGSPTGEPVARAARRRSRQERSNRLDLSVKRLKPPHRSIEGHALGNLLIAALADRTGSFTETVAYLADLLGVRAEVLPATEELVDLCAASPAGTVRGQVAVQQTEGVERVWLDPDSPPAPKRAIAALAGADQIVVGPGSLFTSVLAALAVPELRDAVAESDARCVYVCNLRPQQPETAGYDVAAHVVALRRHGVDPDVVLCHPGVLPLGVVDVEVVEAPVAVENGLAHDPELLGAALSALL